MRVDRNDTGFVATLLDGSSAECRKILLATGVIDKLPPLGRHRRILRDKCSPLPVLRRMGTS